MEFVEFVELMEFVEFLEFVELVEAGEAVDFFEDERGHRVYKRGDRNCTTATTMKRRSVTL